MTLTIREFGLDDLDLAVTAFLEMERHYEGEKAVDEATARTRVATALSRKRDNIYLGAFGSATDPGMIGFVTAFEMFPGPDLQALWYLKDIFVSERARGKMIGEELLRATAQQVIVRGGVRLVFSTKPTDPAAQRFYDRLGAAKLPNLVRGFDGDALELLAKG